LVRLTEALLAAGEAAALVRLVDLVLGQSEKTLRALQALVERYPETPAAFRKALTAAVTALPPSRSFVGRVLDHVKRKP
jgi:hypothetical protein